MESIYRGKGQSPAMGHSAMGHSEIEMGSIG